ncbi:MAG: LEA type 2 family protein [Spirochaetales bacterium]|nr:LEA type 2 family protein [Spirochaetales bacterium]
MRHARHPAAALWAALAWAACAAACSSQPEPRNDALDLGLETARLSLTDQNHSELELGLTLVNLLDQAVTVEQWTLTVELNGVRQAELVLAPEPLRLDTGQTVRLSRVVAMDSLGLPQSEGPTAAWTAMLSARGVAGRTQVEASVTASGALPLVREPVLSVRSVHIVKWELVNCLLELDVELYNPNAFEVAFSQASYAFHGEGYRWATGRLNAPVHVEPLSTAAFCLPITLNFADTGRHLLDLVAKLQNVRYKLTGQALILIPLEELPSFSIAFSKEGSTTVER